MNPSQGMAASLVQPIVLHLGMGPKYLQKSQFIKKTKNKKPGNPDFLKKEIPIIYIFYTHSLVKPNSTLLWTKFHQHIPNLCPILNITDDIH